MRARPGGPGPGFPPFVVTCSFGMPTDPIFAGVVLHNQVLQAELDMSFNITSITSSNGLAVTIGAL